MSEAVKSIVYKGLELWNQVFKTRLRNAREVKQGGWKFTTVDAYSQIERATELWGPFGINWGVESEDYIFLRSDTMCLYKGIFYYPGGKFPIQSSCEIVGSKGNLNGRIDGEFAKKSATDALTKGLSKLGFNGDVFMGLFDDNQYVQRLKAEEEQNQYIDNLKNQHGHIVGNIRKMVSTDDPGLIKFLSEIHKPVWNEIWNYLLSTQEKRHITELNRKQRNAGNQ